MSKKLGVVLSGCGVKDGCEIHESVATLLAISKTGNEYICIAPDIQQTKVTNHYKGIDTDEKRNVLIESARIARGNIKDIKTINVNDLDAIIFPGGLGAALNLSDFGINGANGKVNDDVFRLIKDMYNAKKVIGAICIAPGMLALALNKMSVKATLTIGTDTSTANNIKKLGHTHIDCSSIDCVIDKENRIVTTPAYMIAKNIAEVAQGIEKLVNEVIKLIK